MVPPPPQHYFTLMENTDTTSLLLLSKHHFPLQDHFGQVRQREFCEEYVSAAKDNMMWRLYLSAHFPTCAELLFIYKIGPALDRFWVM